MCAESNDLSCGMMLNKIQKNQTMMMSVNASPKMLAPGLDYQLLVLRFEVYMYTHGAQMVGLGVGQTSRIYRNQWLGLEK